MDLKSFGKTLKSLRKKAGFTQQDLADELQVSTDLISKWERGYQHRGRTWKPDRDQLLHLIYMFEDRLTELEAQRWVEQAGYKFSSLELACLIPPQKVIPYQSLPLPAFHVDRPKLQQLLQTQLNTAPVLILHGPGGAGKTSLAAWAGQFLSNKFPDGVIWVETGSTDPIEATHNWLEYSLGLSLNGRTPAERAAELRALCRDKKYLLIVDDVHPVVDVRLLDVVSPPARLLLTARSARVADLLNAPLLTVTGFLPDESFTFLHQWLPSSVDTAQLELLMNRLGHLPLALSLSGAQLRGGMSIENLLTALDAASPGLGILDLSPDGHRNDSLIACFDLSYTRLTPKLQNKFAQLGCLSSPFPVEAAAAIWQLSPAEARAILGHLLRQALIENKKTQYRLHPLMRDYARLKLSAQPELETLTHTRHAAYYIRHHLYHPHLVKNNPAEPSTLDPLTQPWLNIVAAVKWTATHRPELAATAVMLAHTERSALLRDVGTDLLAAAEAEALRRPQPLFRQISGQLYLLAGRFEAGCQQFEKAAAVYAAQGHWLAAGLSHLSVAAAYLLQERYIEAAAAALNAQGCAKNALPVAPADQLLAAQLFYLFHIIYGVLTRWSALPENDVASLAGLGAQTGLPELHARGLTVYRMWCTEPTVSRTPDTRHKGVTLALQACRQWRLAGRQDRADDEISWTNYRLKNRYSRLTAQRYAQRRSDTSLQAPLAEIRMERHPGKRWWLTAAPAQRIAWLSRMLPRYLGDPHVKPLPKHYLGCAWIKEILNLSAMGVASRRYTPLQLPPPDHSLHGSEWLLFTGQKPLPLAGPDVAQLVAKCLHQLEIISNVVVED